MVASRCVIVMLLCIIWPSILITSATSLADDKAEMTYETYSDVGPSPYLPEAEQISQHEETGIWVVWLEPLVEQIINGEKLDDFTGVIGENTWYITECGFNGFFEVNGFKLPKYPVGIIDSWIMTDAHAYHLPKSEREPIEQKINSWTTDTKYEDFIRTISYAKYADGGEDYIYICFHRAPAWGGGLVYKILKDNEGKLHLDFSYRTWIS